MIYEGSIGQYSDCKKIVRIAKENGKDINISEAHLVWLLVSESYCAGWLMVDSYDDKEVWSMIKWRIM